MTAYAVLDAAIGIAVFVASLYASAHVILTKNDVRAAAGWVGLIWLVPGLGALLYWLLGINRIHRRARELKRVPSPTAMARPRGAPDQPIVASAPHLDAIARLTGAVTGAPLTQGNAVTVYADARTAMDAMVDAINGAERSVAIASYIFETRGVGGDFIDSLADAHDRGVTVCAMVDGVGSRVASPSPVSALTGRGVPAVEFLPTRYPFHLQYANLRNHRKILVIDGETGFTGGLNIRNGYLRPAHHRTAVRDCHARFHGPVVSQMLEAFEEDWAFCTGKWLDGEAWQSTPAARGSAAARAIASGPDDRSEPTRSVILSALAHAAHRVRIATPYFLPDAELRRALEVTALRSVDVQILIPERTNKRLVQWASRARLSEMIRAGCRILEGPPPFDHRKMMTVDGAWSLIGSANWDDRSFRLNFELDIEVYDTATAARLDQTFERAAQLARPLTAEADAARSLPVRLRDGAAWLFSPYL